jgi:WD40 repeat protein
VSSVFISYARSDDEPFVERLRQALEAHGVRVWWDREAMESRGRTFLQELRDAIATVDRVLLVVGPAAIHSDYVDAEWRFAAERCTPIVPLLRMGDYGAIPTLARFHAIDFREPRVFDDALEELLRIVRTPVPALADLHGVPQLPPHYLARPDLVERIEALVLADVQSPPGEREACRLTSLHGMAGSGKSVLAAAFAQSCGSRRAFGDGVLWLRVGPSPNLLVLLQAAGRSLGDPGTQLYADVQSAVDGLSAFLSSRSVLIVADDVWRLDDIEPLVGVAGQRGHLLFTTRDRRIANDIGASEVEIELLTPDQSALLLASWSNTDVERLPPEALDVSKECGHLPLALAIMGAIVRGRPERWTNVLQRLRNADLAAIERRLPQYPYPNLIRAMDVSLETLDRQTAERYVDLAVFAGTSGFPVDVVRTYWAPLGLSALDVDDLVDRLEDCSLLHQASSGRMTLHDLQYDYVRSRVEDPAILHRRLVDAYAGQCRGVWWNGPNDGYFFQHLPEHLRGAGREKERAAVLLDLRWLVAKLKATSVAELIADLSQTPSSDERTLVADALRLSSHVLADGRQLPNQLFGRLFSREESGLVGLLNQIRTEGTDVGYNLVPLRPSLIAPGGPLLQTIRGQAKVAWLGALDEQGKVTTVATDGVITICDTQTGKPIQRGLTSMNLSDATITPDGRFVAAIPDSKDGEPNAAYVWEVATGAHLLLRLEGKRINRVYALPDNRRVVTLAVATTPEHTWQTEFCIWQIPGGELLERVDAPSALWHFASFSEEAPIAVAGYAGQILILDSAGSLRNVLASELGVERLAMADDGRALIAACHRAGPAVPFVGESFADSNRRMKLRLRNDPFWDGLDLYLESGKSIGFGLHIWNTETGELRHSIPMAHRERISALQAIPGSATFVSGAWDGNLALWDSRSPEPIATVAAHDAKVVDVAVSRDGKRAVSVAEDDTLKLWDLQALSAGHADSDHRGSIVTMQLLPGGAEVLTGSHDGALNIWSADRAELLRTLAPLPGLNDAVCVDASRVVCAVGRTIQLVDLDGLAASTVLGEHGARASSVRVARGRCVSAGDDGTIRVWDLDGLNAPSIIECVERNTYGSNDPDPFTFLDLTSDGRYAVAVTYKFQGDFGKGMRVLHLIDIESRAARPLDKVFMDWQYLRDTVLLSSRGLLLSADSQNGLGIWDVATGERIRTCHHDRSRIVAITATPDQSTVVAALEDRTFAVWNVDDGSLLFRSVPFSAEFVLLGSLNRRGELLSATNDGAIQLWAPGSEEPSAVFTADAMIADARFAFNDERVVAVDASGRVHILGVARGR